LHAEFRDPDLDSMGSLDPDSESGFGSRRAKIIEKNFTKAVLLPFLEIKNKPPLME